MSVWSDCTGCKCWNTPVLPGDSVPWLEVCPVSPESLLVSRDPGRAFVPQTYQDHVLRQSLTSALKLGCPGRVLGQSQERKQSHYDSYEWGLLVSFSLTHPLYKGIPSWW